MATTASLNIRQRIAAKTPQGLRKAARMALNYGYRLGMWRDVLRELKPADGRSRRVLWRSLAAAPITALGDLDSYQKPVLLDDIAVEVHGIGRFEVRAKTDDLLHVLSAREPKVRQVLETQLPEGGTFVDGGANIGFYAILGARLVGANGRVVAFEMMPDTAAILRRHVAGNAPLPVEVVERALSGRVGEWVTASVEPGKHGQASIVDAGVSDARTKVSVETVTLDAALAHLGPIDLIKLDLEGAEFMALSGASAVLARTQNVIFESNTEDRRIFDLLEGAGFVVERLEAFDFLARKVAP